MSNTNRRSFLAATGAGAAAGVAAIAVPSAAQGASRSGTPVEESVVAYVDDPASGEITLTVGEREVVVHDRDLVTRLLVAAGGR